MSHGKIMTQGTPNPVGALQQQKFTWLIYPIPIAIGYVLIHAAYPVVSLFVPVIILGICAGALKNTLLQTLMAAMTGSVTTLVFTVLWDPPTDPLIIIFAVFMIFYLVGGLFGLYLINTLRRMARNAGKGKSMGKISKTN